MFDTMNLDDRRHDTIILDIKMFDVEMLKE